MTNLLPEFHRLAKNAPERCRYIEPGSSDYHPDGDDVFIVLLNSDEPFDEMDPLFWPNISGREPSDRDIARLLMALLQEIEAREWGWAYKPHSHADDCVAIFVQRDKDTTVQSSAEFKYSGGVFGRAFATALCKAFNDAAEAQ